MLTRPMVKREVVSTPSLSSTGMAKKARMAAMSMPTSTLPITLFTCFRLKSRLKVPQKTRRERKVKGKIKVKPK